MNIVEFDKRLREIAPTESRPFLCEGTPFNCQVFLVGLNPRTHTPFWPHWNTDHGCHKAQWLADYMEREGSLGRTRDYIEILFEELDPIRCLETNLYPRWSDRISELPSEHRNTDVFDFLLASIKPKVVLVHGGPARKHLERLANRSFPLNEASDATVFGVETSVYARHHLSFQLSKADCRAIGGRLKALIEPAIQECKWRDAALQH